MDEHDEHKNRAREIRLAQQDKDAKAVLDNPAACRFICEMLVQLNYYGSAFATDPTQLAYNVGRSDAARLMVDKLQNADANAVAVLARTADEAREKAQDELTQSTQGKNHAYE